jgi:hypothetical protein
MDAQPAKRPRSSEPWRATAPDNVQLLSTSRNETNSDLSLLEIERLGLTRSSWAVAEYLLLYVFEYFSHCIIVLRTLFWYFTSLSSLSQH